MNLQVADIVIIVLVVLAVIIGGLYFLNRWASKKMSEQEKMIAQTKQTATIYIIDKKKAKASEGNFPKVVMEGLPKWNKMFKMPLVKAKIGPQIMTLMCDEKVFKALPVKKNVKVDIAGIYIVAMKGMKSEQEMKAKANANKKPWYKFLTK